MSERLLHRLSWVVVALCLAPIVAAVLAALAGDLETWRTVLATVLPRYTFNTLKLVVIVGLSTAII
ncbi:MAG: iron ABC transporter permease, partial [Roseovarius sp.]